MYRILLTGIFYFTICQVFSQQKIDFKTAEDKTYQFYLNQQWDSLIYLGNLAIENDIDYFYLRSRMGCAYFEKKNYLKAATHFEKALASNSSDAFVVRKLYYCYVFTNRQSESHWMSRNNPQIFTGDLKESLIKDIFIEAGTGFGQKNKDDLEKFAATASPGWAEYDLTNSYEFYGGGLKYAIQKNVLITNYYTFLKFNHTKQILIGDQVLNDDYPLYQNQLYVKVNYRVSNGFQLIPAFHYIRVDYNTIFSSYDTGLKKAWVERKNAHLDNYAVSLALEKRIHFLRLNIFGNYSKLNNETQKQGGISVHTYPLGNLNFYTVTTGVLQYNGPKNAVIGEQIIGGRIFKYLWIDGLFTYGNLKNYVEQNAFIINNTTDMIKLRYGLALTVPVKSLKFSLRYQGTKRTSEIDYYKSSYQIESSDFNNHMIFGDVTFRL